MASPRGISPELLISQVRNTAPYLLEAPSRDDDPAASEPAARLRAYAEARPADLSHADYFALCLAAHYATCATPVPTDVDHQIRRKLWAPGLPLVTALEMGALVLESRGWRFDALTTRACAGAVGSPFERASLHGHFGEWFTVAAGAYAALGLYRAADAKRLREALFAAIADETARHAAVFGSLWRAKDGLGALNASVSIAHNFGDLDRVIDAWALPIHDPLRRGLYKLAVAPFDPDGKLRYEGRLWSAGELYKSLIDGSSMALENHRHFALRKPRALRASAALRIPLAPFFDAWGAEVAARLEGEALEEVLDALAHGAGRLAQTLGYLRAARAIGEARPEHEARLATLRKTSPRWRDALDTPKEAFEARWAAAALAHLDDIPSRAR